MEKSAVIGAKERILAIQRRLPHLDQIDVICTKGDFTLTVGLSKKAGPSEKEEIREAAKPVVVEFYVPRTLFFQREK